MTGRAVFGDFLAQARRELERATASRETAAPGRDAEEITRSLAQLTGVLGRYADDLTASFLTTRAPSLAALNNQARSAVRVRDALAGAAGSLGVRPAAARPANSLARRLDTASVSLTMARDLLHTHFQSDQGIRYGRTGWATVITSPPISRALLAEIADISRLAETAASSAVPEDRPWPATALARRLGLACHWLSIAASTGQPEPIPASERDLLRAIPSAGLPPRITPTENDTAAALCAGIIVTSQRVSHLAWTQAQLTPWSPEISVTSWRRIASAGTAATHHCHLLLAAIAVRARDLGHPAAPGLEQAAEHARTSRSAWLHAGRALGHVTTDIRWHTSQAATEAADLALWSGRLAFDNPAWRPSDGPRHPTRPPEDIVIAAADLPDAIAAVHYTTDALEQLALANNQQVREAGRAGRILMSARSLPDGPDVLGHFAPVPDDHLVRLCAACWTAAKSISRTADSAGEAATELAPL